MTDLKKGTGTPYVAIFDSDGNPIICPLNNMPIGMFVTKFNYKYVEEGADTAEITIQTNNINIADHSALQYLMPIKLQWGWLYHNRGSESSPVRTVVVKDISLRFSPEGVTMDLDLSDSSFLLKGTAANYNAVGAASISKNLESVIQDILNGVPSGIQVVKSIDTSTIKTTEQ